MRLYLKLLLLLVVALGIQWSITEQWRRSEWLFAFRCQYARLTRDDQMSDRLLDEARDRLLLRREEADFEARHGPE